MPAANFETADLMTAAKLDLERQAEVSALDAAIDGLLANGLKRFYEARRTRQVEVGGSVLNVGQCVRGPLPGNAGSAPNDLADLLEGGWFADRWFEGQPQANIWVSTDGAVGGERDFLLPARGKTSSNTSNERLIDPVSKEVISFDSLLYNDMWKHISRYVLGWLDQNSEVSMTVGWGLAFAANLPINYDQAGRPDYSAFEVSRDYLLRKDTKRPTSASPVETTILFDMPNEEGLLKGTKILHLGQPGPDVQVPGADFIHLPSYDAYDFDPLLIGSLTRHLLSVTPPSHSG